jgi:hypothetical protein
MIFTITYVIRLIIREMLELPRLFPESAFPTDVESQAICTIFIYFLFFCLFPHSNFKKNSPISKKSSLSPLSVLPHPLSLTLPSSLGLSQKLALSLSPSPSQNQKPQETLPSPTLPPSLTLSLTPATVDLRRLPSLTPAQGFRPSAKNGRPCSPSLPRTCLFLTTAQKISGHRRRLTHEKRK